MARSRYLRRTTFVLRSFSAMLAIGLGLAVLAAVGFKYFDKPRVLRIAAGPPGSADVAFADAMQKTLPHGFDLSRVEVVPASSLADASAAVDDGRAQVGIVRSDIAVPKRAGTVLIVHKDAAIFIARPGSKLARIPDFAKKRVGILPADPANIALFDQVLESYGVTPDAVEHVPLTPETLDEAIDKKIVDAVMVVAPIGAPLANQVARAFAQGARSEPVFLDFKDAEALALRRPGLDKAEIPAGLFGAATAHPSDDFTTVGVTTQLVASVDMSEGAVDQLTRSLFLLRRAMTAAAPVADFMQAAVTDKGSRYALHPGATSYYQDTEKSFMDRYGDWFYIVAMILGGLGSAIASAVSSLHARSRAAAMNVIDELCSIQTKAAKAANSAALHDLDAQVDAAAGDALHRARDGNFDQAGLETLRLAISEARHAVAARRRMLQDGGAREHPAEDGLAHAAFARDPAAQDGPDATGGMLRFLPRQP